MEPLAEALRLQRAAAGEGFDWPDLAPLWDKLAEEIDELQAAVTPVERSEELGDLLFMAVNLARHLGIDPTLALDRANAKFARRYAHVSADLAGLPPLGDPARLDAMEERWQQAKRAEKEFLPPPD